MRKIFLWVMLMLSIGVTRAEEPIKGIFATYEGASAIYKLEDVPQVTYTTISGVQYAVLSFENVTDSVQFALADGKTLEITYGEYQPTPTDMESVVSISTDNGQKIIRGGRLLIVKDGKMYDAMGRIVK